MLRPTIHASKKERLNLAIQFPEALLDNPLRPLHLSYEQWRPKLVLSWRSTGLATALQHECLPVSCFNPEINNKTWDAIYPMRHRVLFWPRDKHLILEAIKCPVAYRIQIKRLLGEFNSNHNVIAESKSALT